MAYNINKLREQYTLGGNDYGMNMGGGMDLDQSYRLPAPTYGFPGNEEQDNPPPYQDTPQNDIRGIRQDRGANIPDPRSVNLHSSNLLRDGNAPDDNQELKDMINQFYTPATRATDRFNTLLDQVPKSEDYQPSLMRRIVAAGQGWAGGSKAVQETLNAPYAKALGTWKEEAGPFQQAASLENASNNIERQLAGNAATSLVNARRNDAQARAADERNRITEANNTARNESARITALARDYAARLGKGYEFDLTGPTIKVMNRNTGDVVDTGRPTGKLSEEDRIDLQNYGKIEASRQAGVNAANVAAINNAEVYQDSKGNRYNWDAVNGTLKPIGTAPPNPSGNLNKIANPVTPKTMSPGDTEKARQNTLGALYSTDEYFKQFIEYNADSNTYRLKDTAPQDVKAKIYPELYPPKEDINLPLEPGQQREDRSVTLPPNTGGRGGGPPQIDMTPEQRQVAAKQQQADIQSGKALKIYKVGEGGKVENGVIPNTPEHIADARLKGWTVQVGGGGR